MKTSRYHETPETRDHRKTLALAACAALCGLIFEQHTSAAAEAVSIKVTQTGDNLVSAIEAILDDFMFSDADPGVAGQAVALAMPEISQDEALAVKRAA